MAAALPVMVTEPEPLLVMTAPAKATAVKVPLVTATVVVKEALSTSATDKALPLALLNTWAASSVVD